jgi:hypothetical protein
VGAEEMWGQVLSFDVLASLTHLTMRLIVERGDVGSGLVF